MFRGNEEHIFFFSLSEVLGKKATRGLSSQWDLSSDKGIATATQKALRTVVLCVYIYA